MSEKRWHDNLLANPPFVIALVGIALFVPAATGESDYLKLAVQKDPRWNIG